MNIQRKMATQQVFSDMIGKLLQRRGDSPDDMDRHESYPEPRYVVRMCETMRLAIGNPKVTLADVIKKERLACGHSDYQQKFALYCAELAC